LVLAVVVGACGPPLLIQRAEQAETQENWDAAVAYYQSALEDHPHNIQYEMKLKRARLNASQTHQNIGKRLWDGGDLEQAVLEYELAVQLDPGNQVAASELRHVQEELMMLGGERLQPTALERLKQRAEAQEPPLPKLVPKVDETFSLDFRDTQTLDIYRALASIAGLNVVFDAQVADNSVSLELENVSFLEALEIMNQAYGNFYKPLTADTFIVIPDNQQKRRSYSDQIMRTFFLSNGDAANVAQIMRTLLQARAVAENTEMNTVTIRDTPPVVELAERIVAVADKSRGEVLLDIEILEVSRRLLREYGISLSDYGINQSLRQGSGEEGGMSGISVNRLRYTTAADWFVTIPSIRYKLFKESGDFKLVADPQVRLTEGEAGSLVIGQEVPIVTTTFSTGQLVGNQVVPIRSTTYRDVGIVIGASARVHHNDEVTIELELEVSQVIGESSIEDLPIFATRTVSSVVRLKDGETNILAGLLRDDERQALQGVLGLADIPVVGKLFSDNETFVEQVDVIMSITPHILRNSDITGADLASLYVGTESVVGPSALSAGAGGGGSAYLPSSGPSEAPPVEEREGAVTLGFQPASIDVTLGQEFTVDLIVGEVTDLFSAGIQLSFDSAVLEYVDADRGGFLASDGADATFTAAPSGAGGVATGMSRIGEVGGIAGSGPLATFTFRAIGEGRTNLSISAGTLRGLDGRPMPVQFQSAEVVVEQ
jgi:general secretion pathway protein D